MNQSTHQPFRECMAAALIAAIVAAPLSARAQTSAPPAPPAAKAAASAAPSTAGATPTTGATPTVGTTSLADALSGPAKADYEAGRLLFVDHDYAGALVKFRSAYEQSKEPHLLFNMGACEKNLRHYVKTIADFEQYRSEGGASLTQAEREEVDRYLAELRPFVGTVRVTSNEPGARVTIDDEEVGTTPLATPAMVDIGARRVRIAKDGFGDWSATVMVRGSEEIAVDGRIEKIVHAGHLLIRTAATNGVDVDGQPVGTGGFDGPLPSGGHQVRIRGEGMVPFQTEVLIQDNQTRLVDVTLQPAARGGLLPAWAWIVGGAVVATGLAVGGYLLLKPKDEVGAATAGTISPGTVTLSLGR